MFGHYLTLALRNARRTPFAAAVNVLTLGLGIACFLCAYGFVAYLERAERSFANAERVYVLTTSFEFLDGSFARTNLAQTPEAAAELLALDFPELERVARTIPLDDLISVAAGERALRLAAVAADPEFLEIFALPFAAGERRTALREPGSVVLTQDAARRLFGAAPGLGRSLTIANEVEATVTGVLAPIPEPSHIGQTEAAALELDVLVSLDVLDAIRRAILDPRFMEIQRQNWTGGPAITYVALPESSAVTAAEIDRRLPEFVTRRVPEQQRAGVDITFALLPVRDFLRKSVDDELFSGDFGISVSGVVLGLGVLVLGVACVNYANLAAARAVRRLREVGLRKALGAPRAQIALQHLLEAAALTCVALAAALAALYALLPLLETLSGMRLGAVLGTDPVVWLLVGGLGVFATVAAGAYPAFVLARVQAVAALRAGPARLGAKRLAAVLVGAQFAAASLLVIAVTIVAMQNRKLVETGLGAVTDPILLIENERRLTNVDAGTLRAELARLPQIKGITEAGGLPWQRLVAISFLRAAPDDSATPQRVLLRSVGYDFFRVMDIGVVAGRVFDPERGSGRRPAPSGATSPPETAPGAPAAPTTPTAPTAPTAPTPIVVDRAFVEQFDFGSPEQAIGRLVYFPARGGAGGAPQEIIGVVENRRLTFRGAGAQAVMYALALDPDVTYVRIDANEIGTTLERIDALWNRLAPNVAISRQFFDEAFSAAYERFLRLNQLFGALSLIALSISAVGLVGMATLVAGQRRREIGVRKTLGASVAQMVRMLLKTFLLPVLVANAIVWPIAYLAARAYLAAFHDPAPLDARPFALALAVTLLIAGLASGAQTLRAARAKPADVLRDE